MSGTQSYFYQFQLCGAGLALNTTSPCLSFPKCWPKGAQHNQALSTPKQINDTQALCLPSSTPTLSIMLLTTRGFFKMCCPIPVLNMSPGIKHEAALISQLFKNRSQAVPEKQQDRQGTISALRMPQRPAHSWGWDMALCPSIPPAGKEDQARGTVSAECPPSSERPGAHATGGLPRRRSVRTETRSAPSLLHAAPPTRFSSRRCSCRSRRRPLAADLAFGIFSGVSGRRKQ